MARIVVVGAGGHGREIADVVMACREAGEDVELLGFVDDDERLHGVRFLRAPVLGPIEWLSGRATEIEAVLGIGAPRIKQAVAERVRGLGIPFRHLVHPRASLTRWVRLSEGVVITAGCVLTNEIEVGAHAHVNRCATIGHDCRIGPYCHIAPGAVVSGNVRIEEGCDIGANATILQNLSVGAWTVVGAGAVVTRSLPSGVTAVGIPARPR